MASSERAWCDFVSFDPRTRPELQMFIKRIWRDDKRIADLEKEVIDFITATKLVTLPSYLGPFYIRQLPEAFKPTSPGGFMNPPGLYDKDPSGFYFIPTYDPKSNNFYIRAGIEDPRPLIVHEGFPGHFVQLSIANHLSDEIRRQQGDGVFTEGWALYLEEVVLHEGLIAQNTGGHGQVLRLSRYRAARVGVDANLHTGKWTFDQAVQYFMNEGGLDHEAAEGEAAGAGCGLGGSRSGWRCADLAHLAIVMCGSTGAKALDSGPGQWQALIAARCAIQNQRVL